MRWISTNFVSMEASKCIFIYLQSNKSVTLQNEIQTVAHISALVMDNVEHQSCSFTRNQRNTIRYRFWRDDFFLMLLYEHPHVKFYWTVWGIFEVIPSKKLWKVGKLLNNFWNCDRIRTLFLIWLLNLKYFLFLKN